MESLLVDGDGADDGERDEGEAITSNSHCSSAFGNLFVQLPQTVVKILELVFSSIE